MAAVAAETNAASSCVTVKGRGSHGRLSVLYADEAALKAAQLGMGY